MRPMRTASAGHCDPAWPRILGRHRRQRRHVVRRRVAGGPAARRGGLRLAGRQRLRRRVVPGRDERPRGVAAPRRPHLPGDVGARPARAGHGAGVGRHTAGRDLRGHDLGGPVAVGVEQGGGAEGLRAGGAGRSAAAAAARLRGGSGTAAGVGGVGGAGGRGAV